jgi:hypothetical protein
MVVHGMELEDARRFTLEFAWKVYEKLSSSRLDLTIEAYGNVNA